MNRTEMIKIIRSIMPGTDSSGSSVGQSECIVFKDGNAYTFNDMVAMRTAVPFIFEGAIEASKFLLALQSFDSDTVKIKQKDDHIICRGGKRQTTHAINSNIELPISIVDLPRKWRPVPGEFTKALQTVARIAGRDENKYTLTCVHIAKDRIEATDNIQLMRWPMTTGLRMSALISARTALMLTKYNITDSGITDQWLHFKDDTGLVYSIRTHEDTYPDISEFLEVNGTPIVFPPDIGECASRAAGFLESAKDDGVKVTLEEGRIFISGEGSAVIYEERALVDYEGDPISFFVNPGICQKLSKEAEETIISADRIKVTTPDYEYVAMLQAVK